MLELWLIHVKIFEARRNFLIKCAKAAGAFLMPGQCAFPNAAPGDADFHLHPHYRNQTTLDTALLQIDPGRDAFVNEVYHDKIASILAAWSASLRESPRNTRGIEDVLSGKFLGSGWQPVESRPLHRAKALDVRALRFSTKTDLPLEPFIREMQDALGSFGEIATASFQVTGIQATDSSIKTRIRYEFVGTGPGFYREQRVGIWALEWEIDSQTGYRLVRWQAHDETRSRSTERFYTDVTENALGGCESYQLQMLYGADHWRTLLDGASGIDIYGHNGVSVGDVDGDGHDDIYVCQPAGLPNRLYRNKGDGTFEDITESSGVGILDNTACALFADFDNDGRQDLVVVRANGPLLFLNQGKGRFRLKPEAFQFANPPQGTFTGVSAADYDRDGFLDVYFCLYAFYQGAGQYKYPTPYFAAENGPPNFLMHNNGDSTFRDVTEQCGLNKNNTRFSFCCGWSDYNGDGWPDLYVVNDFGRKNLYRNNGNGTFTDVAKEAGVEDIGAGMSVCWLDYNIDGAQDLYIANMWTAAGERVTNDGAFQKEARVEVQAWYRKHAMGNSLLKNDADGTFRDMTAPSGSGMGRWAWSSDSFDFDHDGFADIYVANGMISGPIRQDLNSFFWRQVVARSPNSAQSDPDYEQSWNAINELIRSDYSWSGFERNVFYANNRDGTFSDVSGALGLDFVEDGRAFALADFDGDGRQEILLKNRNAPQLRLLKNMVSDLPPAVAFRLRGTKSNRDAIGAAVTIRTSAGRQVKFLQAGSGFLSQHSKEVFFGLGEASGNLSATIRWPSGLVQDLEDIPPNHRVWATEGLEEVRVEEFQSPRKERIVDAPQPAVQSSSTVATWLLVPVLTPRFSESKTRLITFSKSGPQPSDDVIATYNLLFRYLFDRHRDLPLPSSFLLDEQGQIVRVYAGEVSVEQVEKDRKSIPRSDAERLRKALPFPGVSTTYEFGRNYVSLGSIFFQRGYVEAAEGFFQAALKDDPASAEAFYGLGSVYLKLDKTGLAREYFQRAAELRANYPETGPNAWNNLGLLAAREGETEKAADYFEKALKLDRDHFISLENLGNAYRQQKRFAEARSTLEHALALKPSDPEANYSLGMVFAQENDGDSAYRYLQKALEIRPAYPEALNNLGILYLRTRRRDDAVKEFEKCISVAPAFDQAYLNLARVYSIEGGNEKARAVLEALLAQHPDHVQAKQMLGGLK
jgi:tetratricopeptide (TPR) repeat protein